MKVCVSNSIPNEGDGEVNIVFALFKRSRVQTMRVCDGYVAACPSEYLICSGLEGNDFGRNSCAESKLLQQRAGRSALDGTSFYLYII